MEAWNPNKGVIMLRKVELTAESIDYINQELTQGGALFIEEHLLALNLGQGNVFTYFPIEFAPPTPVDFGESLEFLTGKRVSEEFNSKISDLIRNFLDESSRNIAIFETMWNESDPITSRSPLQYFTIKGRRYDFLKGEDEKKPVDDYINDAQGYPTIIALINGKDSNFEIWDKLQIPEENVIELTKRTEFLIVGAFDGEGYIVWKKKKKG